MTSRPRAMEGVLARDHALILGAICNALRSADDVEVVGMTHSGAEVMNLVRRASAQVVLLDGRLPGLAA